MKTILVDKAKSGPTAKMVAVAVRQWQTAKGDSAVSDLTIVAPPDVRRLSVTGPSERRLILVTVGEVDLSRRNGSGPGHTACESLTIANALSAQPGEKVCLIRCDAPPLSGADVIAALIGGIAGIVDERLLLTDGVLDALVETPTSYQRSRSMLTIGKSATAVSEVKAMLDSWEEGALGGDGTLDPACWRTAMALAQLDKLRPIAGTGDRYSFVKLAQGLNLSEATTSFHLSEHDLRKTLGMLASVWLDSSAHPSERLRLPTYAKEKGFPPYLPVLAGVSGRDVPKRLYDIARAMEVIEREAFETGAPRVHIRAPIRLFKTTSECSE